MRFHKCTRPSCKFPRHILCTVKPLHLQFNPLAGLNPQPNFPLLRQTQILLHGKCGELLPRPREHRPLKDHPMSGDLKRLKGIADVNASIVQSNKIEYCRSEYAHTIKACLCTLFQEKAKKKLFRGKKYQHNFIYRTYKKQRTRNEFLRNRR